MLGKKLTKGKFSQSDYEALADFCNENNATIVDKGKYYECVPLEEFVSVEELKQNLANTDYVVIKIAEGVATKEEYEEVLRQRAEWRKQINELS